MHAEIAPCGKSIGRRSVNIFGSVKTNCVQRLNKSLLQQAECCWQLSLLWTEAIEVSVEGFLLEQVALVFV